MIHHADDDRFYYDISEWWDENGTYHEGHPTDDELLDNARQLTVHAWDADGNDVYWTVHSDEGWLDSELAAEADDAWNYYVG